MKTQQHGFQYTANALLAATRAAVSMVVELLEVGRLKFGKFAASHLPAVQALLSITYNRTFLLIGPVLLLTPVKLLEKKIPL